MSGYDRWLDELPPTSEKGAKRPKINTGFYVWSKKEREEKDDDDVPEDPEQLNNCALCTAAALTGQTSGEVNAVVSGLPFESDRAFVEYARNDPVVSTKLRPAVPDDDATIAKGNKDLADQIIGLAEYVKGKLETKAASSMDPVAFIAAGRNISPNANDNRARAKAATHFMKCQPNDTVFAVYTTGGIFGSDAHWIYAEKQDGAITFIDYQLDRQFPLSDEVKGQLPKNLPEAPVRSENPLGPNGLQYKDTSLASTFMFVWAFGNGVVQ